MHQFEYIRFADMEEHTLEELGRFKHNIFIRRLGWDVVSSHQDQSLEFDEFDGPGTIYIIVRNAEDAIVGCTRLLPTTETFLLGKLFPNLCRCPVAISSKTWEISRYAAASIGDPLLGIGLFKASIRFARIQGASTVVAVTNCALERYFKHHGVDFARLGAPIVKNRQRLVALQFPAGQFSDSQRQLPAVTEFELSASHWLSRAS